MDYSCDSLCKSLERERETRKRLENSQDTRDGAMDDGLTKTKNMMVRAMLPSSYFFGFFIHFVECFGQVTTGVNFLYFCAANAVARLGIFQKYQDWDGRFEGVLNKK